MPKRPLPPSEYKSKHRHIKIYSAIWDMLNEICLTIGIDSIPQCLSYIIKDLYDTIIPEVSTAKTTETNTKQKREYRIEHKPIPPPP